MPISAKGAPPARTVNARTVAPLDKGEALQVLQRSGAAPQGSAAQDGQDFVVPVRGLLITQSRWDAETCVSQHPHAIHGEAHFVGMLFLVRDDGFARHLRLDDHPVWPINAAASAGCSTRKRGRRTVAFEACCRCGTIFSGSLIGRPAMPTRLRRWRKQLAGKSPTAWLVSSQRFGHVAPCVAEAVFVLEGSGLRNRPISTKRLGAARVMIPRVHRVLL